jgi:hypothetical protein
VQIVEEQDGATVRDGIRIGRRVVIQKIWPIAIDPVPRGRKVAQLTRVERRRQNAR